MADVFKGSFTQQGPIPKAAIEAALRVLGHGRLHRYNLEADEVGEVALLEQEFATFTGARYCLAVASGGYAMSTALRAMGVGPGDKVLTNAFTLAPVPGAIASLGAVPVLVEVSDALTIDINDLQSKITASGAPTLLLSHMRGHICDMDRLMAVCNRAGVQVVEDCAHTMGAGWAGTPSGRHGAVACYSTQTYKHLNSGEGGLIISDDADIMARSILLSGSYMLYERHLASPPAPAFEGVKYDMPNISGRMDNLRAAILRPQLKSLPKQCENWNERYRAVENGLRDTPGLQIIQRPETETFVGSSIQFLLVGWNRDDVLKATRKCAERGVELKWFGAEQAVGFTSKYSNWHYIDPADLPQTNAVLAGLLDMRLPLTFSIKDCEQIAGIIRSVVSSIYQNSSARDHRC